MTLYPNGQCDACGWGLDPQHNCRNRDCQESAKAFLHKVFDTYSDMASSASDYVNPDDEPNEPMTGWDTPEDVPAEDFAALPHPGRILLHAISEYIKSTDEAANSSSQVFNKRFELLQAMRGIDWTAIGWTLVSLQQGQELYSCYPGNDVLTKYHAPAYPQPGQEELAF